MVEKDIIVDESFFEEKPAWEDEQDKELLVNLNKSNRLKKLKTEEGENKVTGAEFSKRLKRQYTKMKHKHKLLDWAETAETDSNKTNASSIDSILKTSKSLAYC